MWSNFIKFKFYEFFPQSKTRKKDLDLLGLQDCFHGLEVKQSGINYFNCDIKKSVAKKRRLNTLRGNLVCSNLTLFISLAANRTKLRASEVM